MSAWRWTITVVVTVLLIAVAALAVIAVEGTADLLSGQDEIQRSFGD